MVRLTYEGYTCLISGFTLGVVLCLLIRQVQYTIANKKFERIMREKRLHYEKEEMEKENQIEREREIKEIDLSERD